MRKILPYRMTLLLTEKVECYIEKKKKTGLSKVDTGSNPSSHIDYVSLGESLILSEMQFPHLP